MERQSIVLDVVVSRRADMSWCGMDWGLFGYAVAVLVFGFEDWIGFMADSQGIQGYFGNFEVPMELQIPTENDVLRSDWGMKSSLTYFLLFVLTFLRLTWIS